MMCKTVIRDARIPKWSLYNKIGFLDHLDGLKLYPLKERLVVLRIPFVEIRDPPCSGQKFIHENIVNVPGDTSLTFSMLPRNMRDTETVEIRFYRRKEYKNNVNLRKMKNLWQCGKH